MVAAATSVSSTASGAPARASRASALARVIRLIGADRREQLRGAGHDGHLVAGMDDRLVALAAVVDAAGHRHETVALYIGPCDRLLPGPLVHGYVPGVDQDVEMVITGAQCLVAPGDRRCPGSAELLHVIGIDHEDAGAEGEDEADLEVAAGGVRVGVSAVGELRERAAMGQHLGPPLGRLAVVILHDPALVVPAGRCQPQRPGAVSGAACRTLGGSHGRWSLS